MEQKGGIILDYDIGSLLARKLAGDRRPPDGLLHPSGDLVGSLRHSMLRAAGAPTVESELVSDTRLMTGTMWHTFFEQVLRGTPTMCEVKLDRWLPEGWSGTADWIMWNDEYKAFVLGDLKTTKGEGIKYIDKEGIKNEHMWQCSAYWYALRAMGIKLVKGFTVMYLPMNAVPGEDTQPLLAEGMPLDGDLVLGTMEKRWNATKQYLDACHLEGLAPRYTNEHLAPVQDRVTAVRWNKDRFEVKYMPHWSAAYCPYPNELCDCSEQGITKIGEYIFKDGIKYVARKGYEKHTPSDLTKQQKERLIDTGTEANKLEHSTTQFSARSTQATEGQHQPALP